MKKTVRVGIIGNGYIAAECARIIDKSPMTLSRAVIDTSRPTISGDFEGYLSSEGHPWLASSSLNEQETLGFLSQGLCDVVLSVNNHQIIRAPLLERFPGQIINFHNGPLPRYAGLNAPSWAIFNGESCHGVTWHVVDGGVDTGDILTQRQFAIPPATTARQLMMTAIDQGIDLCEELVAKLAQGNLEPTRQDLSQRTFYQSSDVPGEARIDLTSSYDYLNRLVRALNFNPLESPLPLPGLTWRGRPFFIDSIALAEPEDGCSLGMVVQAEDQLVIQGNSFAIEVTGVRNERRERVPVSAVVSQYGIVVGMHLDEYLNE